MRNHEPRRQRCHDSAHVLIATARLIVGIVTTATGCRREPPRDIKSGRIKCAPILKITIALPLVVLGNKMIGEAKKNTCIGKIAPEL